MTRETTSEAANVSILSDLNEMRKLLGLKRFKFGAKNSRFTIHFSRDWEWPWAIISSKTKKGDKVLDVGSGCTPFLPLLSCYECKCYAVDPDPLYDLRVHNLLKHTTDFYKYVKHKTSQKIVFRKESMSSLSFPTNFFDKVFCISVIEHIEDMKEIAQGIKEMSRVLKKGGILVITVDNDGEHVIHNDIYKEIIRICPLSLYGGSDFAKPGKREMVGKYNVCGLMFYKD